MQIVRKANSDCDHYGTKGAADIFPQLDCVGTICQDGEFKVQLRNATLILG